MNYHMGYVGGGENYLPPTGLGPYSRFLSQNHHQNHNQHQNQIQIQPLRPQDGPNLNFNTHNGNNGMGHGHTSHLHPLQDNNLNGSGHGHAHCIGHNNGHGQNQNQGQIQNQNQGQNHGYGYNGHHGHIHGHGHGHGSNNNNNSNGNINGNGNSLNNSLMDGHSNSHGHGLNIMTNPMSNSNSCLSNINNPWPPRCNNCPNFAEIFCPRCEMVGYCSEAHLVEDEMNHKTNCFPEKNFTEIHRDPETQEVLFISSANNLGGGDSICKTRALMMIPHDKNLPSPPNSSLCLGCCKWFITGSYKCSVCHWPVCSLHCETSSLHGTYECEIFNTANVSPSYFPGIYDVLLVLRCVLMMDHAHHDDAMRQAFRDWNAWKVRPGNEKKILKIPPRLEEVTEKFLLNICRLNLNMDNGAVPEFLREVMNFAYSNGLCQENRVSIYDSNHVRNYHSAKYVFGYKYAYTPHCSPNTSWAINYAPTLREANLHIWATSPLKIGDKLTACFDQNFVEYGTHERRLLQLHFNSKACDGCERCLDPTECHSMVSAIRCCKCGEGYLLPVNPLDLDLHLDLDLDLCDPTHNQNQNQVQNQNQESHLQSKSESHDTNCLTFPLNPWRCYLGNNDKDKKDNCERNPSPNPNLYPCPCDHEVEAKEIFRKLNAIAEEINDARNCIGKLGRIIKKLKNHVLHPRHYLIARAADRIVELGWLEVTKRMFISLDLYYFKPIISAANICLTFADAVASGYTKLRAKYIYVLQMIHGISETHNAVYHFSKDEFVEGRLIRLKFDKIHLYQKEFARIAQHEKVGSCLFEWLEILEKSKDDLGELLRTTTGKRAFDGFELERLKRAFSYFCPLVYEPNLPPDLQVDVSHIVFFIDPTPFRPEYKIFFEFGSSYQSHNF